MQRIARLQLIRFLVAVYDNYLAHVSIHVGQVFDVGVVDKLGAFAVQLQVGNLIFARRVQAIGDSGAGEIGLLGEKDQLEEGILDLTEKVVETRSFFVAPTCTERPLGMEKHACELHHECVRRLIIGQLDGLGQELLRWRIFDGLCLNELINRL